MHITFDTKPFYDGAQLLLLDGPSRSGKAALAPFLSSLHNTLPFQHNYILDQISILYETDQLTRQGFDYMIQTQFIKDIWFYHIGRNVNTNDHDISSIKNLPQYQQFLEYQKRQDTPSQFRQIEADIAIKKPLITYMTDEYYPQHYSLVSMFPLQYLVLLRNPIQLAFSWFTSGRGVRSGVDRRYLGPTLTDNGLHNIPIYYKNAPSLYHDHSELERCVYMCNIIIQAYLQKLQRYDKCKVMLSDFDSISQQTSNFVDRLQSFLNVKLTPRSFDELKKANLPRKLDFDKHALITKSILANINTTMRDDLHDTCKEYAKTFVDSPFSIELDNDLPTLSSQDLRLLAQPQSVVNGIWQN